jgi:hypothetical protein
MTSSPQTFEFAVIDVVAASCAAFRVNGFVKRDDPEVYSKKKVANSNMLYTHFCNDTKMEIIPADVERAHVLVEYLKGLSFKAFERTLTSFESNVLKFVTSEKVGKDQLGIAASLPSVYERKLEADAWTAREAELASTSEYVGTVGSRAEFTLKIENVRYIAKTDSSLYSCSEGGKNIVKFFSVAQIGAVGDTITVTGFIKNQSFSKYSSGKETMINRVKLNDK